MRRLAVIVALAPVVAVLGCDSPAYNEKLRYCSTEDFRGGFTVSYAEYHERDDAIRMSYWGPARIPHGTYMGRIQPPLRRHAHVSGPGWAKGVWYGTVSIERASEWSPGDRLLIEWVAQNRVLDTMTIEVDPPPNVVLHVNGRAIGARQVGAPMSQPATEPPPGGQTGAPTGAPNRQP
jgi:hypothetical protein